MTSDYANEAFKRIMTEKVVDLESRLAAEESTTDHYRKLYSAADRARLLTENRLKATQEQLEEQKRQLDEEREYSRKYILELTSKNKNRKNVSDSLFSPVAFSGILLILCLVGLFIPSWFFGLFAVVSWEVIVFLIKSLTARSMNQL